MITGWQAAQGRARAACSVLYPKRSVDGRLCGSLNICRKVWWIMTLGTILVGALVLGAAGLALRSMIKDKKRGKPLCGGDCGKCRGCH